MDYLTYLVGALMLFAACGIIFGAWRIVCNERTYRKRAQLIKRIGAMSHDRSPYAFSELSEVEYEDHFKKLFLFRNPKGLYGPVLQNLWGDDWSVETMSEVWWRCYIEIYRTADAEFRWCIRSSIYEGWGLLNALILNGASKEVEDIAASMMEGDDTAKFSMADGAEEYEQAMAAQELMSP